MHVPTAQKQSCEGDRTRSEGCDALVETNCMQYMWSRQYKHDALSRKEMDQGCIVESTHRMRVTCGCTVSNPGHCMQGAAAMM